MANLGKMLEGPAYGILNEILAEFRSDDGFARPTRFEIMILFSIMLLKYH